MKGVLSNYERDDKYVRSLKETFDNTVCNEVNDVLDFLDKCFLAGEEVQEVEWRMIAKERLKYEKDEKILIQRFMFHFQGCTQQYFSVFRRFIMEHLRYPNGIISMLQFHLIIVDEEMRLSERDMFDLMADEANKVDVFLAQFYQLKIEILDELIAKIKLTYKHYLDGVYLQGNEELIENPEDDIDFNSMSSKTVLLNELGIIDFLKNQNPSLAENNKWLGSVLSKLTGTNPETVRRQCSDMNKGLKNDPYKNKNNLKKVEDLFKTYEISKKGE